MRPHPAFAGQTIPPAATLGAFRLRMLCLADLDEDMAAIVESAADLRGFFDDEWPDGLTRQDDALDLAWHEREFTSRRSFAFVIGDAARDYIGCAYVSPPPGTADRAEVWFWLRTSARSPAVEAAFRTAFAAWLDGPVWPRLAYDWRS